MRNSKKEKRMSANTKGSLRLLAFSLVCILLFCAFSVVFHPKDGMDTNGYSHYITYAYKGEEENTLDVVFAGNSNVYRAINPIQIWEEQGITSCVIGGPVLEPGELLKILEDVFKKQSPKVVVIEANCFYSYSSDRNDLEALEKTPVKTDKKKKKKAPAPKEKKESSYDKDFLNNKLSEWNDELLSLIAYQESLMKYHDRWQELSREDFTETEKRYYLITKGFLYSTAVRPFYYGDSYMGSENDEENPVSEKNVQDLKNIKALCDEHNAKMAVVCAPSGKIWNYAKHKGTQRACDSLGISFTDYNTEIQRIGFDWLKDRKDNGDHLNIKGATKVTGDYAKILADDFGLTKSKLTPEQEEHWNSDAQKYHNEVEK